MKKISVTIQLLSMLSCFHFSCREKKEGPSQAVINEMDLKRGELISCGPPGKEFGSVDFEFTGKETVKADFNLAVKLLHSFEYDEAEKVFAEVIDEDPACAMGYWGIAMSNFHALWTAPTEPELKKGSKAIEIAGSITQKTKREADYINAIGDFYKDWDKVDHRSRCTRFEKAMEMIYTTYKTDKDAAAFYALSLVAAADPADKTFASQKKAGTILAGLYPTEPGHPGIAHYLIHSYDSPELALLALPAARKYASIAPSSAHALHMPSHIFTRLGYWDECIQSNIASVNSALCYAESAGIKGHWDEELHGLDYLVYAYLQKGENDSAKKHWDYLQAMNKVQPVNFKVAYAFAAIPSRYLLENKIWEQASKLEVNRADLAWKNYPWQKAIIHFTRLMGLINTGNTAAANSELRALNELHAELSTLKDVYKANQVNIQIRSSEAWIRYKEGKQEDALALMYQAADMEDKTEKHPVTPCEVIPARELLGDLLLAMNKPGKALEAYEADLQKHPNRFNGLYGAGLAAEKNGNKEKAKLYYEKLLVVAGTGHSQRPELIVAKKFLGI